MTLATTNRAQITQASITDTAEQLQLLEKFVHDVLIVDRDFGVIPGTGTKPTLLKPGAHNIMTAMQCYSQPKVVERQMDTVSGFFYVECMTEVIHRPTGDVVAVGYGSCNSYERKYRYRNTERACPTCGKEAIMRSKFAEEWYCWGKKDGCGAKFSLDHPEIVNQQPGQVENTDLLDQANTYLKMAEKRADVDAAMKLPGVARFFTQDIGDVSGPDDDGTTPEAPEPTQQTRPAPQPRQRATERERREPGAKLGNCAMHPAMALTPDLHGVIGHPQGIDHPWCYNTPPSAEAETPVGDDASLNIDRIRAKALALWGSNDLNVLTKERTQWLADWVDAGYPEPEPEDTSAVEL